MAKCINAPHFIWRIDNYCSIEKDVSPSLFSMDLKWRLRYIRFTEDSEYMRLILECLNVPEALTALIFKTEVYVVYSNGSSQLIKNSKYNLKDKEWCLWKDNLKNFQKLYADNSEYVIFSIVIEPTNGLEKLFRKQKSVEEINHESACFKSLSGDFGKLFNNNEHSDFILECSGKKFYVHKIILSARSEYFAAMFRCNMKEVNEGTGKIGDIEPDILELVLRYLYTGEVSEISMESLPKVYAASDRFGVDLLKVSCYLLFIDSFKNSAEGIGEKFEEDLANRSKQAEIFKTESQTMEENKLLKDLFMSREWISFSQAFPLKAQEMCKQYLLQNM